jgi:hypothetical protein
VVVDRTSSVKYLGVLLNENLNLSDYANVVLKKAHARLGFLYRQGSVLNKESRKLLCSALIQPYLEYCCSSWFAGVPANLKHKFVTFQRKMVRLIFGLDSRSHVGQEELRSLSWLSQTDRVSYFRLSHMYKIFHGHAPPYLLDTFTRFSTVHSIGMRGNLLNFVLLNSSGKMASSFLYLGSKE